MTDPNMGIPGTENVESAPEPRGKGTAQTLLVVATVLVLLIAVWASQRSTSGSGGGGDTTGPTAITDLQGGELDLAQYKGKVVLINFWATWCQPCLTEIPWMMEFQEKYADRGFTVLGVSMDDEGMPVVEPWVREKQFELNGRRMPVNYPILIGGEKVGQQFGGIIGLPTTLVISRDGTVIKRFIGLTSHDTLIQEIEKQL